MFRVKLAEPLYTQYTCNESQVSCLISSGMAQVIIVFARLATPLVLTSSLRTGVLRYLFTKRDSWVLFISPSLSVRLAMLYVASMLSYLTLVMIKKSAPTTAYLGHSHEHPTIHEFLLHVFWYLGYFCVVGACG